MNELSNITFKEYIELEDKFKYNYVATYSRVLNTANDLFNIGEFNKLTFGQVKDAQTNFQNGVDFKNMLNFVTELKGIKLKRLAKYKFFELCKFRRFIEEQIDHISRIEANLYYQVSALDESAGIDRLAKFGVGIQIDKLALGQVWMYDTVKALPYDIAFFKLLMDKEVADYDMNKNNMRKTKI